MNIVLLRVPLTLSEINQLTHEFPQYLFLSYPETALKKVTPDHWARVEVLFGEKLSQEELEWAHGLKWIHTPSSHLTPFPLSLIEQRQNILLTYTREENASQIGEFVLGITLAYAKQLFNWKEAEKFPALIWDAKWRQSMLSLQGKTLVQIGMDKPGIEIAKKGLENGMHVISIDKERNFHPHCKKNLSIKDLHKELPSADVVSIHLPQTGEYQNWFGLTELKLMKEEAILILIGPTPLLNKEAHEAVPHFKKLRGALIDASYHTPLSSTSPLWNIPNLLITPGIAGRPKTKERQAFKLFKSNLRDYLHSNYLDMRYLVNTSVLLENKEVL